MNTEIKNKLLKFFSSYQKVKFKKGTTILRPFDPLNGVFYLEQGFVKQFVLTEKGDEITLHIYRPETYFPIMVILSGGGNHFFFESLNDVVAYKAPQEKVLEFLQRSPDVLFDLTTRFAKAISGLSRRIELMLPEQAYVKICSLLVYLSQILGKKNNQGIELEIPFTHRDIASWTGVTRETASRQFEKLITEGIISIEEQSHHIVIKDLEKLNQEILEANEKHN